MDPCFLFFVFPSWPLPEFDPSQIRLIVYQDCERRGRNVLFDSSVKRKNEDTSVSVSVVLILGILIIQERINIISTMVTLLIQNISSLFKIQSPNFEMFFSPFY